jgi:hypothetical protein
MQIVFSGFLHTALCLGKLADHSDPIDRLSPLADFHNHFFLDLLWSCSRPAHALGYLRDRFLVVANKNLSRSATMISSSIFFILPSRFSTAARPANITAASTTVCRYTALACRPAERRLDSVMVIGVWVHVLFFVFAGLDHWRRCQPTPAAVAAKPSHP